MHSGRTPHGSRKPYTASRVSITTEYAPSAMRIAARILSVHVDPGASAIVFARISESDVAASRTSSGKRSASSSALVRLPLCANANWPSSDSSTNGCALTMIELPVVE